MYRAFIIFLLLASFATAQTKKPGATGAGNKKPVNNPRAKVIQDSLKQDSLAAIKEDFVIPKEFAVYTRRSKNKKERMKLCINLVSSDSILNYCINDSICKDPEVSKILFEKKAGDSTYVLVYVRAFSKPVDKVECDAGKEVKLFFMRWNTKTNKALVKQKTVESCMKGVTNMTKESIDTWENTTPLIFKYYRTGDKFYELKFDPQQYLLGLQSANDN